MHLRKLISKMVNRRICTKKGKKFCFLWMLLHASFYYMREKKSRKKTVACPNYWGETRQKSLLESSIHDVTTIFQFLTPPYPYHPSYPSKMSLDHHFCYPLCTPWASLKWRHLWMYLGPGFHGVMAISRRVVRSSEFGF